MPKVKSQSEFLRVRTVSLSLDLYGRLEPIIKAAEAVGETEAFVIRQIARIAIREGWSAAVLDIPADVKRDGGGDRVTPRLALPNDLDVEIVRLTDYSALSRWYSFAVERFLAEYRKGEADLFRVL